MERFEDNKLKYFREGVAKTRGLKSHCKKTLCIFSTDISLLLEILHEASLASDCYEVELIKEDRLNVLFGKCTFTNEASVGDAWAKYTLHPQLWVVVQDEEFCDQHKDRIRNY